MLKNTLLIIFITLILIEVTTRILAHSNVIRVFPEFDVKYPYPRWAIPHEELGIWHLENTTYHHKQTCFDAKYDFNEFGFKVSSSNNINNEHIFIVGDSFIEGFGLDGEKTIPAHLEKGLSYPLVNLGVSSSHFINYLNTLKKFKNNKTIHTIITVLVENDFTDLFKSKSRAGFYLVKNENDYSVKKSEYCSSCFWKHTGHLATLRKWIYNRFYFLRYILRFNYLKQSSKETAFLNNEEKIKVFNWFVKELKQLLNENEYSIVLLQHKGRDQELVDHIKEQHPKVILMDKKVYHNDNYFTCDYHFNEEGAKSFSWDLRKKLPPRLIK
jgi:hypothetical protein